MPDPTRLTISSVLSNIRAHVDVADELIILGQSASQDQVSEQQNQNPRTREANQAPGSLVGGEPRSRCLCSFASPPSQPSFSLQPVVSTAPSCRPLADSWALLLCCLAVVQPSGRVSAARGRPLVMPPGAQRAVCHFISALTYCFHLTYPLTPTSTVNRGWAWCKVAPSMNVAPVSRCRSSDRPCCDFPLLPQDHETTLLQLLLCNCLPFSLLSVSFPFC